MIKNVRSKTELAAAEREAFRQTVESLVQARPDLSDPEKLRVFKDMLSKSIAAHNLGPRASARQSTSKTAESEINAAKKFTSFATAVSGAVSAGLIAASIAPGAPEMAIAGVALIGLLGSKYVARSLDRMMERNERGRKHLSP